MVARRAVWRQEGGAGAWLYYGPAYSQWIISDEEDMEAGATSGWMYTEVEWIVSAMVLIGGGGIRKEALSFGSGRGAYSSFHVGYIRQTETEGWKN